jgi:hypothetical protein
MSDDFRLTVELEEERHLLHFGRMLREREIEKELHEQLGQGVVVTHDGPRVFLYTTTREQAEAAEKVVRGLLSQEQIRGEISPVLRWHPVEERWEDASVALPQTETEVEAEHQRWEKQQAEEARALGYAEWEVRVDLPTHKDAVDFARRIEEEGISPIVRRWKYILIGVENDDAARALAERLRTETPQGSNVKAEPSSTMGWELTARNPFATFGGLGPAP